MDITVTKKINCTTQLTIKFDGEQDLKEALLKATPFMQLKAVCGICQNDKDIELRARQTKDGQYIYVELYCPKCKSKQEFGEYKQPKGALFLKKWEKYTPQPQSPERR